jgi:hypothetical protein
MKRMPKTRGSGGSANAGRLPKATQSGQRGSEASAFLAACLAPENRRYRNPKAATIRDHHARRLITSTYRYKRPPRKRKAVPLVIVPPLSGLLIDGH